MANTYTWSITSMSVMQTPQPDYVVIANWNCEGTDGTNVASCGGISRFEQTSEGDFTPYADLTEAQVIGWVQAELGENGVTSVTANIDGQIDSMVNPPVSPEAEPLPW